MLCNSRRCIFSVVLSVILLMCFTFNVFALDLVSRKDNPMIDVDGWDREMGWNDSTVVVLSNVPAITASGVTNFVQCGDTIYGVVAFDGVDTSNMDLVIRVDIRYKNYNGYIIFVMPEQLILFSENNDYMFAGATDIVGRYCCAEFSFSLDREIFEHGDLVDITVKYGTAKNFDDYENMYLFSGQEILECYVGGKLPEPVTTTRSYHPPKTTKEKTTKATSVNAEGNAANSSTTTTKIVYTTTAEIIVADVVTSDDTKTIIFIMLITCIITVAASISTRKIFEKKGNKYTDDDKGCD